MSVEPSDSSAPSTGSSGSSSEATERAPAPVLRREALLPSERQRGLGAIAVVCTMAGVASGLALATTLMAMQVADSMAVHNCPYRVISAPDIQEIDMRPEHGFLGIRRSFTDGVTRVTSVLPNSPAAAAEIRAGDRVVSIDGHAIHTAKQLEAQTYAMHPGTQVTLVLERDGEVITTHPILAAWPTLGY
jgi:predicted metalloprotease with PDZ domain